ncbi:MAG: acyloxyacyl hydrolase [Betaproteobacteria bacterium]|jgi:lipid A 3-O-deacylase|nr:acyloxyacyl hydrolase [Betaproteobacteria bacterium]
MIRNSCVSGLVIAVSCLAFTAAPASAVDGLALEIGREGGRDMARVAVQWHWQKRWLQSGGRHIGGYWDLSAGQLNADALPGQNDRIADIGFTPTLRWQPDSLRGFYVEGGIGARYLSQTTLGAKRLSTRFQFGDHAGFGYRFGAKEAFELGYRYQHLSNADIKRPNDGLDFHQLRLQYWFR